MKKSSSANGQFSNHSERPPELIFSTNPSVFCHVGKILEKIFLGVKKFRVKEDEDSSCKALKIVIYLLLYKFPENKIREEKLGKNREKTRFGKIFGKIYFYENYQKIQKLHC